jgi:hypothetical protein
LSGLVLGEQVKGSQLENSNQELNARLISAADVTRSAAESLSNPETIIERLKTVTTERKELELLEQVHEQRAIIADEIERLKARQFLEEAKNAASTATITKKVSELSEESITEIVRNTFILETDRLKLERVTIAKTRADKGSCSINQGLSVSDRMSFCHAY